MAEGMPATPRKREREVRPAKGVTRFWGPETIFTAWVNVKEFAGRGFRGRSISDVLSSRRGRDFTKS
jgi:hypothetical protein